MRRVICPSLCLWLVILGAGCGDAGPSPSSDVGSTGGNASGNGGDIGSAGDAETAGGGAGASGSASSSGGASGSHAGAGGSSAGGSGAGTAGAGGSAAGAGGTSNGGGGSCPGMLGGPLGAASGTPGMWQDVTPAGLDLASTNVGAGAMVVDPVRPSDVYLNIQFRGTWKSKDYGLSWTKISTGANADKIQSGYATYAAIDRNPCRDSATPPAMYFIQLFGAGGILKSVDGGVSWSNVWSSNIYAPDGVTNISSDVGGDVHSIHVVDPSQSNHLIATLHGYMGSGGNNGVFESTDGGAKWTVRKTQLFTFQPHNNIIFPLDAKTWLVTPGTISDNLHAFRTTDGATSWVDLGAVPMRGLGRELVQSGSTAYAGTDYNDAAYKSIDAGKTWTKLMGSGAQISWVVATRTKLYTSGGYTTPPVLRHADIAHDDTWVTDATPPGMINNGNHAAATFDGTHYVIIAAQAKSGIWRYIEP